MLCVQVTSVGFLVQYVVWGIRPGLQEAKQVLYPLLLSLQSLRKKIRLCSAKKLSSSWTNKILHRLALVSLLIYDLWYCKLYLVYFGVWYCLAWIVSVGTVYVEMGSLVEAPCPWRSSSDLILVPEIIFHFHCLSVPSLANYSHSLIPIKIFNSSHVF